MSKVCEYKLTREEEIELFENLDEAAKERICESMIGLVKSNAYKWRAITEGSIEDCEGLCWIGVMNAINKFDPYNEKGARFSTYAALMMKSVLWKFNRDHHSRTMPAFNFTDVMVREWAYEEDRTIDDYLKSRTDYDADIRCENKLKRFGEMLKGLEDPLMYKIFTFKCKDTSQPKIAELLDICQPSISRRITKMRKMYNDFE